MYSTQFSGGTGPMQVIEWTKYVACYKWPLISHSTMIVASWAACSFASRFATRKVQQGIQQASASTRLTVRQSFPSYEIYY